MYHASFIAVIATNQCTIIWVHTGPAH